ARNAVTSGFTIFKNLFLGGNFICCPSVMARRACYERSGKFNPTLRFALDYEMWMRLALYYDVGFINEPLIKYRWHDDNVTNSFYNNERSNREDYRAKEIAFKVYAQSPHSKSMKRKDFDHFFYRQGLFWSSVNEKNEARKSFL